MNILQERVLNLYRLTCRNPGTGFNVTDDIWFPKSGYVRNKPSTLRPLGPPPAQRPSKAYIRCSYCGKGHEPSEHSCQFCGAPVHD
jgi:hypothetical protein